MPKPKKQSKAKGLRSSINLNSNKGKLIVFMLAFAVIGGGYMLYNTFAATTPALVYTASTSANVGSENYLSNTVLSKINADGTGNTTIAAGSWYSNPSSGTSYSSVEISPNSSMAAWTQTPHPTPSTTTLYTKDLTSTATKTPKIKSYTLPAGESHGFSDAGLVWSPDGKTIALVTYSSTTSKPQLRKLDLTTGTFSMVTAEPSVEQMISMDILGDSKTIVYSDGGRIRLIAPGATTSKIVSTQTPSTNGSCNRVRARPGTQKEFVYICSSNNAVQVLFRQTVTGSPIVMQTIQDKYTENVGDKYAGVSDFALSPDNTRIALYLTESTVTSIEKCEYSFSSRVAVIGYDTPNTSSKDWYSVAKVIDPFTATGCKGGINFYDTIAWSPDSQYIAYVVASQGLTEDGALYTVPADGYASYGGAAEFGKKIVDKNVVDVSW